ncbi:lipid A deacylase LpxR family protein [Flavobacterium sp.]|uniref:lipid A deacylase LpxR family protein n=1 Tax=Flavobacterium sp. TaxID=239 RepID=UPI002620727C|nr:lipid A deacylase LpxR family protein [Flavobacterium sp.]MDD3003717.1 lipid A deacylase LpxR family protein [Flavobacterium sp.]
MKNVGLIYFLFLFNITSVAQNHAAEVGLILENDLYTSTVNDKYYTNGFEFYYRYLNPTKNQNQLKKITEFRVVQYIYNPQTIRAERIDYNDRPFAAVLFAEAGMHQFFTNNAVLKFKAQMGFMGPNAFGKEVQNVVHQTFRYKPVSGWKYQIHNAALVQGEVFYAKKISTLNKKNTLDVLAQAELKWGTIWNQINIGPVMRIGFKKLLPVSESNLYDASIQYDKEPPSKSEFYFFISPKVNYQIYDATIQGSFFSGKSPVTFDLIPWRFQGEAGFKYQKNNWNLHYTFNYCSQEADNIVNSSYYYGSIGIGYLLN